MNNEQKPPKNLEEALKIQKELKTKENIRQLAILVLTAFINYLLMNYNTTWLFGVTLPPLSATLLSFVFIRYGIPMAITGFALDYAGVHLPLMQLHIN